MRKQSCPTVVSSLVAFAIGCASGKPAATPVARPAAPSPIATVAPPSPAPSAGPAASPLPAGVPDTPAGHQLAWVLDVIVAHHGAIDRNEVTGRLSPAFLEKVSADLVVKIFAQLGEQLGGLKLGGVTSTDPTNLAASATVGEHKFEIALQVEATTHQIRGLLIKSGDSSQPVPHFASYDELAKPLAELAPHASVLVAAVDGGTCKPLHAIRARDELAIGSAFKLYVLLGLADRLIAGKQSWEDELAVVEDWKSLPSGITQDDPAGTKLSIRTLAERMISISDNTATDHLLYTVGRKAVEAALREAKHAKPALDIPFYSTRELFLLKTATADQDRYLVMPEAKRRAYLDHELAGKHPKLADLTDWKTARQIDRLEWFASNEDLCGVMSALWTRSQGPKAAAVLDVLSKNPGMPLDAKTWPYIAFKGGSEPGVLDLTWLLRRDDNKWLFVSLVLNSNEGGVIDEDKALAFATGLFALAATSDR